MNRLRQWYAQWSARRHPRLLAAVTLLAAFLALGLLIANVQTPAILYKAF